MPPSISPSLLQEQPHLVSLVLQSKKALQHGEQLCSRAHTQSNASAQVAVDVLALDAKVRWISESVIEQLRLAASVAKIIEDKRAYVGKKVQAWDTSRTKHTDTLESILESLGAQLVPPDFHQSSSDSSLFGSQHSEDEDSGKEKLVQKPDPPPVSPESPSATLRHHYHIDGLSRKQKRSKKDDRKRWKTLRDFVDDQGIEDILETIEVDRNGLDDTLSKIDNYPETLKRTISSIRSSLPEPEPGPPILTRIQETLISQEDIGATMARSLESLASHYDQMATALRESEAGEAFSEEDLQDMNRDTEELHAIMAELEESEALIQTHKDQLVSTQETRRRALQHLENVLDDLDELGEIMEEMLQVQDNVEAQCDRELSALHERLRSLEELHEHFVAYQTAFSKLILEIARRRQYSEAVDNIVKGMMSQLEAMTEEESHVRSRFNSEYGAHLPEDLCLCIGNAPTKWEVIPYQGETRETLPEIDEDLILQARDRIGMTEAGLGTESL
ncbi:autophagy protein Apg17-domain-containing protein [Crucibulum laeve]|uniref:Autophagy-related protein 17 n=1 Tax=Crucibulum laeve TaxID=68775 RepID=A0A5C3M783_9AGAR|nr:autophagy protein Apg17-domain-containing protein [Crucibulum laeve]